MLVVAQILDVVRDVTVLFCDESLDTQLKCAESVLLERGLCVKQPLQ